MKSTNLKKKMPESQFSFCPMMASEQPSKSKSLDVVLNFAGVKKISAENFRLRSTWRQIRVLIGKERW